MGAEDNKPENLPHVGLNAAGVGLTIGDWQVGLVPATSTDDRYDREQERDRIEHQEDDEREARRLGEKAPDPVGDLLRQTALHQERETEANSSMDRAITSMREQIAAKTGKPDHQ